MRPPGPIQIRTLTSEAITPYLPALAALRISVFRDWPYLYDGEASYERDYMRSYAASPRAAIIAALGRDEVIGVSTCLPLADESANVQAPFIAHGMPVQDYFYFGESVLKRDYRNQGIGVAFFAAREAHAASFGSYTHTTFCAVQRPRAHPLRPADATPLDAFWTRRGYRRQDHLHCSMRWRDIGQAQESAKHLTFWTKALP